MIREPPENTLTEGTPAMIQTSGILDTYCYGPGDVTRVRRGDSTLWVTLRDCAGRKAEAVYEDCVYWPLLRTGMHLTMVQQVTALQLLRGQSPAALALLRRNAADIHALLTEWESQGLSFYLHTGFFPEREFLIIAGGLRYHENGI